MILGQKLLKNPKYGGHFEIQNGHRKRIQKMEPTQVLFARV